MFWFTESLELDPEYDTCEQVYEEIDTQSHLMRKVWITEKFFD
jgi:hypothetical protein